jgi:HlyD family secretion protein
METEHDAHADPRREEPPQGGPGRGLLYGLVAALVVAVGIAAYALAAPPAAPEQQAVAETVPVKRGPLQVSVSEGGALVAAKSVDLKSEVEGRKSIIQIVEEGYVITQEDVENGKVLVELDSADLEESLSSREISFYNTEASFTQAREDFEIQKKQNESDISLAELDVKFARMELERYLGAELAGKLLEEEAEFSGLGATPLLGGTAEQELQSLDADVQLAQEELSRAEETLDYTQQLFDKEYVSRNELKADQLAVTRRRIQLEAAQEELRLFKRYTLPKEAEQRYSDYVEKQRNFERVKARARSKLAQASANLKSREASYELEKERLEKVRGMLEKCTIEAPQPGRVVYASTANPWRRRNDPIREGETVRENQSIITIPDLSTLAARVSLHETDIQKVKEAQPARVKVEAMPGRTLKAHVKSISPVASSAHAWLNPEIKVYETDVALDEIPEGLTPGMTATAEIVVADLQDCLYVPIDAITTRNGQRVCLARTADGREVRPVEVGHFTEEHVEIREGLQEGEVVYLDAGELIGEQVWESELQTSADEELIKRLPEEAETAEPEAAEPAEEEAGEQAEVNWREIWPKLMQLRGLGEQEREEKLNEILKDLPEEQRRAVKERIEQFSSMSDEERRQMRQRRGGGGAARGGW